MWRLLQRLKCDVFNDVTLCAERFIAQTHTLSPTCTLLLTYTRFCASSSHANTLNPSSALPITCQFLPIVMLKPSMLKVALRPFLKRCFLELASIALAWLAFNLFLMPLVSCSLLCQFRLVNSPSEEREKKNVVLWLQLVLSAGGELSETHHFFLRSSRRRISFKSSSTPLSSLYTSFLSLCPSFLSTSSFQGA